ncbi:carboxypeptidase regulatory-like domain-containing protein [Roseiconus nitratireducens]|uniref:Carboxypeptidase regulatory-like domain-containing protein n=1 Tax=Roseiconus nitratireducens TaxID=2605748 RepID=A0A5M6DL29_9BACT|nr:carboxypeptidase regulatory-like domain-containing protein [Roseiconus nitratireducens]KAA5547106.1 carboxypeptidase regulatory-like domain-containing protein [Roseiconus nitratireducens]
MSMLMLAACVLLSATTSELSGRVLDSDGKPISKAIVVVSTARPRLGPLTTCPSCYRDCAKRTMTDENGDFQITGLSDKLLFTLAAGAHGYQGAVTEYYDPGDEPDVTIELKTISSLNRNTNVRGSVVDLTGQPIAGAEIRTRMIRRAGGRIGGADDSVTTLTLTDDSGGFELLVGDHISGFDVRAVANGFSPEDTQWFKPDDQPLVIRLGQGASLKGKLVFEGRPVSSVEVGCVQKNRMIGNVVTPREIFTDGSGVFHFQNLPPDREYTLYTHTGQSAPAALPVSLVRAPGHGECAEFGDVSLVEPSTLTLSFKTDDGSPLPKDSYVRIGRPDAWRGSKAVLAQRSSVEVQLNDVPNEKFEVSVRVPGYSVSSVVPPSNLDPNARYSISVNGDTRMRFVVKRDNAAASVVPSNQSL